MRSRLILIFMAMAWHATAGAQIFPSKYHTVAEGLAELPALVTGHCVR